MKRIRGYLLTLLLAALVIAPLPAVAIDSDPGPGCAVDWTAAGKRVMAASGAGGGLSQIVEARAGQQECFDRFVIDMNAAAPSVTVEYVTEFRQAGSGLVVPLRGPARLYVHVFAPAHDEDINPTYDPPDRNEAVAVAGYRTFRQIAFDATYEGNSAFGVGLRERLPFRVFNLDGPGDGSRVVLDVAHAWTGSSAPQGASPLGNFERAAGVEGGIDVKGWVLDPDTPNPTYAWVTVDGAGRHLSANVNRPDVGAAFPGYDSRHGFLATIPASPGAHRVCVTASNVGPGNHTPLGCRNVSVPNPSPFGNFERATGVEGGVEVKGWMADPTSPMTPLWAWVTVDGVGRHMHANGNRPDVGAAFPGYGSNHGFLGTVLASPGAHRVCVTATNIGPGSHTSLGCRTVTVPNPSPFGNFESARQSSDGIEVKGWMADPNTPTTPIYAWVTVDGVGRHLYANGNRPDVGAAYPGYGPNHGFRATIPASPGVHRVCVTAANVGPGSHTSLGCRTAFPPTIPTGTEPYEVLVAEDAGLAFVSDLLGTVSVIDTATNTVTATLDAGYQPADLAYDPLAGLLYVADIGGAQEGPPDPAVLVFDVATLELVDTIDVGGGALLGGLAGVDPADGRAYVHVLDGDLNTRLSVIDTSTMTIIDSRTYPATWNAGAQLDPDADLLYVQVVSTGQLLVIDLATLDVAAEIPTGFAGSEVRPMAIDLDAGLLYVSEFEGPLHVIDTSTFAVLASIPMGSGDDSAVGDVVLDQSAGVAYVLKSWAGEIDVVDTTSHTVVDTIEVGGRPSAAALDDPTGTLYVVDGVTNTVSFLDLR